MKEPFEGKVSPRLIAKLYKNRVFYNVESTGYKSGNYTVKPCVIWYDECFSMYLLYIQFKDEKFSYRKCLSYSWLNVYENYDEAKAEAERRNKLYTEGFYKKPFVKLETLEKHKIDLIYIENTINKYLAGFENFEGIDFCDVSAGGIQIRGHHKEIKGYTYGAQPTIKYDFSNIEEAMWDFIKMWGDYDAPHNIYKELAFIKDGEKYGWD